MTSLTRRSLGSTIGLAIAAALLSSMRVRADEEIKVNIDNFTFELEKSLGGNALRMALPWNAQVEADIWSVDGRLLARSHPGRLNPGNYRLTLPQSSNSAIGFLKIRLRTENGVHEFSRKVAW